MGRLELGTKYTCDVCAERFYDLNRSPAICPKCGARQRLDGPRARRPSPQAIETRRLDQQPEALIDDADPETASASEAEDGEDAADAENEFDADIEIKPSRDAVAA